MTEAARTIQHMYQLDDLSRGSSPIHKLHPLVKLFVALAFLITAVSYNRFEITAMIPLIFYPIMIFSLSDIPVSIILKRLLYLEPFIIAIGILNPVFDQHLIIAGGFEISRGWITFLSIFIKSGLTVTAALLLLATTGMDDLAAALRMMRIPRILVLQMLLTYRYAAVLLGEVSRASRAYLLRAPGQTGVNPRVWGPFAGQIFIRTYDRSRRIYQAMLLRGFNGEYNTGADRRLKISDVFFLLSWIVFFIIVRAYDLPLLAGILLTGVIK